MKKTSLLLAIAGLVFISSCGKEDSLGNTTWMYYEERGSEAWTKVEISFTDTRAVYRFTNSYGNTRNFTGTYTYDPPRVAIVQDPKSFTYGYDPDTGEPLQRLIQIKHEGTVNGKTMTIGIHETLDLVAITDLKKQ